MKISNVKEVEGFLAAVKKCRGNVYLQSLQGDIFNLKSDLSQYVAIGALLGEHGEDLELFCEDKEDQVYFFEFFHENPDVVKIKKNNSII